MEKIKLEAAGVVRRMVWFNQFPFKICPFQIFICFSFLPGFRCRVLEHGTCVRALGNDALLNFAAVSHPNHHRTAARRTLSLKPQRSFDGFAQPYPLFYVFNLIIFTLKFIRSQFLQSFFFSYWLPLESLGKLDVGRDARNCRAPRILWFWELRNHNYEDTCCLVIL